MTIRRKLFALLTAVLALLALSMASAPAQAAGFTPINVWNSSHCLDNATENAAKLHMWSCTGGSEQRWLQGANTTTQMFTFTNQHTGRCITAPASGTGTVVMGVCNAGATTQQWRALYVANPTSPSAGWYVIWQNRSSGYCLSTPSVGNGTLVQTWPCDIDDHYQKWHQQ